MFNPLQPSHSIFLLIVLCVGVRACRSVSDGTHQCSARVVKLSLPDRLTDMAKPSISDAGRAALKEGSAEREGRREEKQVQIRSRVLFCFFVFPSVSTDQTWHRKLKAIKQTRRALKKASANSLIHREGVFPRNS